MNRKLIISEEEKTRILNLHESRRSKELGFLFEDDNAQVDGVYNNDKDYDYKKEGDNYFFKLKANPASAKAQAYKKQGKFANWTAATGAAKDAIAKLPFLANLTAFQGPGEDDGTAETDLPQNAPTTSADTAAVTTSAATPTTSAQTTTQTTTVAPTTNTAQLRTGKEIRQDYRQVKQDLRQKNRQANQDRRSLERELRQLQNDLNSNLANKMGAKDKLDRMERIKQINAQLKTA